MPRVSMTKSTSRDSQSKLAEQIKKKAYELYEKRGRKSGYAMDDWLEAERIVKNRTF